MQRPGERDAPRAFFSALLGLHDAARGVLAPHPRADEVDPRGCGPAVIPSPIPRERMRSGAEPHPAVEMPDCASLDVVDEHGDTRGAREGQTKENPPRE